MFEKIKNLANIFSKITVCVLAASAIYISVLWGLDAEISVRILWQIILETKDAKYVPQGANTEILRHGGTVFAINAYVFFHHGTGYGRNFSHFRMGRVHPMRKISPCPEAIAAPVLR